MTDCGCETARQSLNEFLDNELRAEDAADIREHIAGCPECAGELQITSKLSEALARACKEQAPEKLRSGVLDAIRRAQSEHA